MQQADSTAPGSGGNHIRIAEPGDAAAIANIYNHYVAISDATFEEVPVSPDDMIARICAVQEAGLPWLVCETRDVAGYAYATPWKARFGYRFTTEISVYVSPSRTGQRIGSDLYAELIPTLEARGIRSVVAGIALPNDASIALHERIGMKKVAHFERIGTKFGKWIDVGYWQMALPREGAGLRIVKG